MYQAYYSKAARDLHIWAHDELKNGARIKASKIFKIAQDVEKRKRESGVSGNPVVLPPMG